MNTQVQPPRRVTAVRPTPNAPRTIRLVDSRGDWTPAQCDRLTREVATAAPPSIALTALERIGLIAWCIFVGPVVIMWAVGVAVVGWLWLRDSNLAREARVTTDQPGFIPGVDLEA